MALSLHLEQLSVTVIQANSLSLMDDVKKYILIRCTEPQHHAKRNVIQSVKEIAHLLIDGMDR